MKSYQWVYLALFVLTAISFDPAFADHMLCARTYITGLQVEHQRGLAILGPQTTSDPQKMSVFITIGKYHGKKALYVQSNFKPAHYLYPLKVAFNEDVDIHTALDWIMGKNKPQGFDPRGVTFYADPSFYGDSTYGKYQAQLTGKVIRLKGDYQAPGKLNK